MTRRVLGEDWRAWLALLVGVLVITGHTASSYTLAVLMKPILAELDWIRSEFAFARFLRLGAMIVALAYVGQLTDRFGSRVVFVIGALVIGGGTLATSAMSSLPQFVAIMTLMGPGQACVGAVAASALVLRQFERRKGVAIGILNGGDNLLSSLLPSAATGLTAAYGWRSAVGALGLAYFVLVVLVLLVLQPEHGRGTPRGGHEKVRLRDLPWGDRRLWLLCSAYFFIYAFITALMLHLHAFLTDSGLRPDQASSVMSRLILVGAVGAPLFGWLCERIGSFPTLAVLTVGLIVSSVVLWLPVDFATLQLWAIGYGLVNSGVVAVLALALAETFGAQQIGRLMGVAMTFCMLSTMLADVATAALFDVWGSYAPVWRGYTVLLTLTLIPVGLLLRRPSR